MHDGLQTSRARRTAAATARVLVRASDGLPSRAPVPGAGAKPTTGIPASVYAWRTPRSRAVSTIAFATSSQCADGSGPEHTIASRPREPEMNVILGQSMTRTPSSAQRAIGRVCWRSMMSARSSSANVSGVRSCSCNTVMAPEPARPASTQPVNATIRSGSCSRGCRSKESTRAGYASPEVASAQCDYEFSPSRRKARPTTSSSRLPSSRSSSGSTRSSVPTTTKSSAPATLVRVRPTRG